VNGLSPRDRAAAMTTEVPMLARMIHVEPTPMGRWIVRHEHDREPLSEHDSATEAERVARERARLEGVPLVLVHDRYARVHRLDTGARPPNPSAA
jgi:hypothetical protein